MYINMWWIRLFIIFITYLTGHLNISDIKIWKFTKAKHDGSHSQSHCRLRHSHTGLNNKPAIVYDPNWLKSIEPAVQHDHRLKILPFNAIKTIRELLLNVKPSSRRHHRRTWFAQTGANTANLVKVKKFPIHDPNIVIATVNVQSLRSKELQISELFNDHGLDILVLTETWLTDKEMDKIWMESTDLNKGKKSLYTYNRSNGRGGSLGLTCKSQFKVKVLKRGRSLHSSTVPGNLQLKTDTLLLLAYIILHTAQRTE